MIGQNRGFVAVENYAEFPLCDGELAAVPRKAGKGESFKFMGTSPTNWQQRLYSTNKITVQ